MKLMAVTSSVVGAWLVAISALHAWLNLDLGARSDGRPAFRVGFLPVT